MNRLKTAGNWNKPAVFLFPMLILFGIAFFSNGTASAFFWQPPVGGVTQSTPNFGEHESNCAPWAPTGDTSNIRCQTQTINPASYYSIWEPAPSSGTAQTLAIEVNDYCLTGYESFHVGLISGSLSGKVDYSTQCMGKVGAQESNVGTIYLRPTNCTLYNNNYCEAIISVNADSPTAPNPITNGINPDNTGGFYGGNVYVAFCLINGTNCISNSQVSTPPPNSDIEPGYSTKPGQNPATNVTTQQLSFNGFNVTDNLWPIYARQSSLYTASVKFQVPMGYNGTAYLAWKGAVSNLNGSGTESWNLQDVTQNANSLSNPKSCPNNTGCSIPDATGADSQTQAQDAAGVNYATFNAQECHTYTWTWQGQNNGDPIALSVPFPMNPDDLNLNCWQLDGQSEVGDGSNNCNSNNMQNQQLGPLEVVCFNNRVGNDGYYSASYYWQDEGCYYNAANGPGYCNTNSNWHEDCSNSANAGVVNCRNTNCVGNEVTCLPASGNTTCSPGPSQTENYCPSYTGNQLANFQYIFPDTAQYGDGYCERVDFSNAYGPSTLDNTSSMVCVSYKFDQSRLTCKVTNVSSTWGNGYPYDELGGSNFTYDVSFHYGSPDVTLNDPLTSLGTTYHLDVMTTYPPGSMAGYDINSNLYPGTSGTWYPPSLTAPNDTASNPLTVSLAYYDGSDPPFILANCTSVNINDYQQFSYTANALSTPIKSQANQTVTNEDPGAIKKTYSYAESGSSTQPNVLNIIGGLYYIAPGGAPPSYSTVSCGQPTQVECDANMQGSPSPITHYYNIPGTPNAGDSYCILMSLYPSAGYVGPGGNYINPLNWANNITQPNPSSGGCNTIHNEPYVSVTGNDVIGNADFSGSCQQPNSSGIYTFSTNSSSSYTPPYSTIPGTGGSASQFGAQAINIIEGFGSASLRNGSNSYLPKGTNALGLSFANGNPNTSNVSPSPPIDGNPMGGDFGYSQNDSSCEPDYYSDDMPLSNNLINVNSSNIDQLLNSNNTPAPSTSTYNGYNYYSASSLTIGSGGSSIGIDNGVKATIFVNGNVYITSNIVYNGANGGPNGWSSIADIPSFYIIAKGNIFIDPNVTQLDGAYIAQPTSSTSNSTGIIDTCANGFQAFSVSALYGNSSGCDQQLTVNGAFADQATLLDRSFSSLRYSEAGENTISNFSGHNSGTSCGHPGQDIHNSFGSNPTEDCAAEIFNFSPELYLSQPSFQPASGPTIGKYNFVTSLSPTL